MILPIGDDQIKGGYFPFFSYTLIIINVIAFMYQVSMSPDAFAGFVTEYGSIPAETIQQEDLHTLLTSMFLHGSWMHLIGNMLFLWIFADNIEATIGNLRFLFFYLLGGMAAHAAHLYFNLGSEIPTVGASGAISAVMGAYLIMYPTSKIKMLVIIFVMRVPAFIFLIIWIGQQWMSGQESLQNVSAGGGVAWWAHIGGFAFGVIAGLLFRMNFPKPQRQDRPLAEGRYQDDFL